jgi:endonuclease/exonuclease/phosphatase family metal-dependent hydrolase
MPQWRRRKKYRRITLMRIWKEYIGKHQNDTTILIGDFNAKVGKEQGLTPNVGK